MQETSIAKALLRGDFGEEDVVSPLLHCACSLIGLLDSQAHDCGIRNITTNYAMHCNLFIAIMQILVTAPKDGEADALVHGTRPKGQGLSDSSLLGTVSMSDSIDS